MTDLHDVALLHDIGKIAVPDAILAKQGPLSETEWEIMREHPVMGAELLASVDTLRHIAPAVRAEHERWDGRGYPDGLIGEEIPIASRVVFVCDAYHSMVSHRPYREAREPAAARAELDANAGTQFWPDAAAALLRVLERGQPRALSQITVPRQPPSASERAVEPEEPEKRRPAPSGQVLSDASAEAPLDLNSEVRVELDRARSAAQRAEAAWRAAIQQRDALREALERLLEVTKKRYGYSPRVFIARGRAEAALREVDSPPDSED